MSASQALIDYAIEQKADALLVHHGYFWKNEATSIRGIKANRIRTLIKADINLYAYHLPLDAHPELGNNAQLAQLLEATQLQPLTADGIVVQASLINPLSPQQLAERIEQRLNRKPLYSCENAPTQIKQIAICTGAGQDFIEQAAAQGMHAFISGEVSERTILLLANLASAIMLQATTPLNDTASKH